MGAFLLDYLDGRQRRSDGRAVLFVLGVSVMLTLGLFAMGQYPERGQALDLHGWAMVGVSVVAFAGYGFAMIWTVRTLIGADHSWRLSLRVRAVLLNEATGSLRRKRPWYRWPR